jgi:hypothetical protein
MSLFMQLESRHSMNVCNKVSSSANMPLVLSKITAEYGGRGKYLLLFIKARILHVTKILQLFSCQPTLFTKGLRILNYVKY